MKTNKLIVSLSLLALSSTASWAGLVINPAFTMPGGASITTDSATGPVNLGMVFTPVTNINVNALGFYDTVGVTKGQTVQIYDASQNLLASTVVPISGPTQFGEFWQTISPVELLAGNTYTVSTFTDGNIWTGIRPGADVNSLISFVRPDYYYANGPAFPFTVSPYAAYFGPDFSIGPVPEPSSLSLFAAALMGSVWLGKAAKTRRA